MEKIEQLFNTIQNELLTINGSMDYYEITEAIITLSNEVHNYNDSDTESLWWIGEGGYCDLVDMITGAYWHYSEWHAGQSSQGYLALSTLGQIYTPNMETVDGDNSVYIELNTLAATDGQ